jgi:ribosomal protein L23
VRNGPPHTDDPFTATFRVSLQLTKPDIRSYLAQIYGLEITSLRTANYIGEDKYYPGKGWKRTRERTYKKVLVGLVEPFWYPEERSKEWLEREFMT